MDCLLLQEYLSMIFLSSKRNAGTSVPTFPTVIPPCLLARDTLLASWQSLLLPDPRQNDISCLESGILAAEGNDLRDVENEVGSVIILMDFSIYFGPYRQIMGVLDGLETRRRVRGWTRS